MSTSPSGQPANSERRSEAGPGSSPEPASAAGFPSFTCFMARRLGCRGPGLRGCPWCRAAARRPWSASAETPDPLAV